MNKVVVVGCGNVGMAYSYSLLNQNTKVDELILIDIDNKKALGNAMDLSHALLYSTSKIKIKAGSYIDCKDAKIVVITAGVNQKSNETRLEIGSRNAQVLKDIVSKVVSSGFNGIFLVATNPVDVMSYMTKKYSKFKASKVIGTGCSLDTARLSFLLSDRLKVNYSDIHAYVLGEHGDSSFVSWSNSKVGVVDIRNIISKEELNTLEAKVRKQAYKIIDLKGETSYGLGVCMTEITNAIINDENKVMPVSVYHEGIYLSMPAVINKDGIKGAMKVNLNADEDKKLRKSESIIRKAIKDLEE